MIPEGAIVRVSEKAKARFVDCEQFPYNSIGIVQEAFLMTTLGTVYYAVRWNNGVRNMSILEEELVVLKTSLKLGGRWK